MFVGLISSEHSSVWEAGASVVSGVARRHSLEPVDEEVRHTLATLGLSRRSSGSRCCRWWNCCGAAVTKPSMERPLKDCFFPVFLYFPLIEHPFEASKFTLTPLVHFDFLGLQLGTTFVTELQSSMKVAVILHWYFTFPHLTWPMSNCSVTRAGGAGVVVVVVVVVGGAPPPGHFGDIPAGQAPASRGQTCVNPGAQA